MRMNGGTLGEIRKGDFWVDTIKIEKRCHEEFYIYVAVMLENITS